MQGLGGGGGAGCCAERGCCFLWGGGLGPKNLCTKNGPKKFVRRQVSLFPTLATASSCVTRCDERGSPCLSRTSAGNVLMSFERICRRQTPKRMSCLLAFVCASCERPGGGSWTTPPTPLPHGDQEIPRDQRHVAIIERDDMF